MVCFRISTTFSMMPTPIGLARNLTTSYRRSIRVLVKMYLSQQVPRSPYRYHIQRFNKARVRRTLREGNTETLKITRIGGNVVQLLGLTIFKEAAESLAVPVDGEILSFLPLVIVHFRSRTDK